MSALPWEPWRGWKQAQRQAGLWIQMYAGVVSTARAVSEIFQNRKKLLEQENVIIFRK